jgi:hypothetical protein
MGSQTRLVRDLMDKFGLDEPTAWSRVHVIEESIDACDDLSDALYGLRAEGDPAAAAFAAVRAVLARIAKAVDVAELLDWPLRHPGP